MTFLNLEVQTEIWKILNALKKIWNPLPYHIKTSDNLNSFKAIIKCWDENHCTCRVCKRAISR